MAAEFAVTSVLWKGFVEDGEVPESNFILTPDAGRVSAADLGDGDVLLQLLYLSVDPYMRGRMRNVKGYFVGPFEPGKPVSGGGLALVKASRSTKFAEGDVVNGMVPWSSFFVADAAAQAFLNKVEPSLLGKVPLSYNLGTLGMPGATAYCSIKRIAEPKEGEVAFVSGAAGAVGLVAGQLLKHVYGCRVIGSAGSDDKVALLKSVGFDAAFNYKTTDTAAALAEAAPDGIDIYFDNVGGKVLEDVISIARDHARIVACGAISQYDLAESKRYGIRNLFNVVTKRIKMQGFIVSDYATDGALMAEFAATVGAAVADGRIVVKEQLWRGLGSAGAAFVAMMRGGNTGKAVVQVAEQDPFPVVAA